jgi:hypothetical protein
MLTESELGVQALKCSSGTGILPVRLKNPKNNNARARCPCHYFTFRFAIVGAVVNLSL